MLKVFTQKICPICSKLKEELKKIEKIEEIKIFNMELKNQEEFKKYKVLKVPVSILVDNNDEEISRFYGSKTSEDIQRFIKGNQI